MANKKYKICVSGGASGEASIYAYPLARKVGEEIARRGHILITGATNGVPFEAAKAAKAVGGENIGFSPAKDEKEHVEYYHLPADNDIFDHIIYAEAGYTGRNLLMVRSSDAVIVIDGRIGSLNEFTAAYEEFIIAGVLEGSGGIADEIRRILKVSQKGDRKVIFDKDPVKLVEKVIAKIKEERGD